MSSSNSEDPEMDIKQILKKKRDGQELTNKEIHYFVNGLLDGSLQDSQIGAMIMAIYLRGITTAETETLTKDMVYSGDVLKWEKDWTGLLVDKHSTGGVGDKISIPLAPALAACGLKVPMLSGRSLDFTGGTLDKLESIPGFNVSMSKTDLENSLKAAGCFIAGTTGNICPADKVLYRTRDATSTVDYYNLITSSIISKKASEGIDYLVIDLKIGEATFTKDIDSARILANQLISVSKSLGIQTRVLLTRMDTPLGRSVGNALEVIEAIKIMSGEDVPLVKELVIHIGGNLLKMTAKAKTVAEGEEKIKLTLENGKALKHFKQMIISQGVSEDISERLCDKHEWGLLPNTKYQTTLNAEKTGWVANIKALPVAILCYELGSVTETQKRSINYGAGVEILKVIGEHVGANEPWIIIHHPSPELTINQINAIKDSIVITPEKPEIPDLLINVIE